MGDIIRQGQSKISLDVRLDAIRWKEDGSHFAEFANIYLNREFRRAIPKFHKDFFRRLVRHLLLGEAWPRGFAKTTILKMVILYFAVTAGREDLVPESARRSFALYIGKTQKIADRIVRQVRKQLETNAQIRGDFGELLGGDKESTDELELTNGFIFVGLGAGGSVRGLLGSDGKRPDLIVVDDLVDKKLARSISRMVEIVEWLLGEVLNLQGERPAQVVMLCNRMHRLDPFGQIKTSEMAGEWEMTELSAVVRRDENGLIVESLWEDVHSSESLNARERRIGRKAFRVELENKPYESDELTFSYEAIIKWKFQLSAVDRNWAARMFIDVASASSKGTDNSVLGIALRPPQTKQTWLAKAKAGNFRQGKLVSMALEMVAEFPTCRVIGVEGIGIGLGVYERMQEAVRERGLSIQVILIDNGWRTKRGIPVNKTERVENKQQRVDDGDIRWCADLVDGINETCEFPNGEHDDWPDWMEGVDSLFESKAVKDGKAQWTGTGVYGVDIRK